MPGRFQFFMHTGRVVLFLAPFRCFLSYHSLVSATANSKCLRKWDYSKFVEPELFLTYCISYQFFVNLKHLDAGWNFRTRSKNRSVCYNISARQKLRAAKVLGGEPRSPRSWNSRREKLLQQKVLTEKKYRRWKFFLPRAGTLYAQSNLPRAGTLYAQCYTLWTVIAAYRQDSFVLHDEVMDVCI